MNELPDFFESINKESLLRLGFPVETIKSLTDKTKELIVSKDMSYNVYRAYEKKTVVRKRVKKSLKKFKEKRKIAKAVDADKIIKELDLPKFEDTEIKHKVTKIQQDAPAQKPAARMDQKSRRKSAAREARPVTETNLDNIPVKKRRSRKPKVKKLSSAQRRKGALGRQAKRTKAKLRRMANDVRKKYLGPKGGGWKLFRKDVKSQYKRVSGVSNTLFGKGSKFKEVTSTLKKNPWTRKIIGGAALTIGASLAINFIRRSFFSSPVIPDEYERGYDIMNEYLTDYGSPLRLSKAAHKALRPYYPTGRRTMITNVKAVEGRNAALRASKNAIGHTRY